MATPLTRTEKFVNRLARNRTLEKVVYWGTTKSGYRLLSRAVAKDDVLFLNLGYEEDPPMRVPLEASDEPDRFPIQLYHATASQAELSGKQVLEVSCGHGGGASYLVRTFHPASYTGLDLNSVGVSFCQKRHELPGLKFVQGNAQDLPFPDRSFDVVINIEAGLHYLDFPKFLSEVTRVLRQGGHFLYADLRDAGVVPEWEATLDSTSLRKLSQRDINAEVLRGLENNRLLDQISRRLPFMRRLAGHIVGGPGSTGYQRLERNELVYRMFEFTKD